MCFLDDESVRYINCISGNANTASKKLPKVIQTCQNESFVIVDECHKAGSKVFSQIYVISG